MGLLPVEILKDAFKESSWRSRFAASFKKKSRFAALGLLKPESGFLHRLSIPCTLIDNKLLFGKFFLRFI